LEHLNEPRRCSCRSAVVDVAVVLPGWLEHLPFLLRLTLNQLPAGPRRCPQGAGCVPQQQRQRAGRSRCSVPATASILLRVYWALWVFPLSWVRPLAWFMSRGFGHLDFSVSCPAPYSVGGRKTKGTSYTIEDIANSSARQAALNSLSGSNSSASNAARICSAVMLGRR
jgi:hypothetical protein